jgi:hypothetical protein
VEQADPASTPASTQERPASEPAAVERLIDEPLNSLVGDWISVEEAARRLGVVPSRVHVMARNSQLVVTGRRRAWIPAHFVDGSAVLKGLPGTLTLLKDAGYNPEESVVWLYTSDDTLPGRPVDALCEDRGTEVRRRAQALGF